MKNLIYLRHHDSFTFDNIFLKIILVSHLVMLGHLVVYCISVNTEYIFYKDGFLTYL